MRAPDRASGPIIATTPPKPAATPMARRGVSFSSAVSQCATSTVKSGAIALRIDARPLAICACPQTISEKGMMLLGVPIARTARHAAALAGMAIPATVRNIASAAAASSTRSATMVKVGSPAMATPMKKNDPPHSTESATSIAQSPAAMVRLTGLVMRRL